MYLLYITESRVFCRTWQNLIFKSLEICFRRYLIVRASIENTIFAWNIRRPSCKKSLYWKCLLDQYKKPFSLNMLFGGDTKELFLLKMPDAAGKEKAPLTQYARRDWHGKAFFTENARRAWYKKSFLTH